MNNLKSVLFGLLAARAAATAIAPAASAQQPQKSNILVPGGY